MEKLYAILHACVGGCVPASWWPADDEPPLPAREPRFERIMAVRQNDQPHLVPPMKLTVYDDLPGSSAASRNERSRDRDSRSSAVVNKVVNESRQLASRASVSLARSSMTLNRVTKPSAASTPTGASSASSRRRSQGGRPNISAPTDFRHVEPPPQLRSRSSVRERGFRPLELSIYLPGNRLSELPDFDGFDLSLDEAGSRLSNARLMQRRLSRRRGRPMTYGGYGPFTVPRKPVHAVGGGGGVDAVDERPRSADNANAQELRQTLRLSTSNLGINNTSKFTNQSGEPESGEHEHEHHDDDEAHDEIISLFPKPPSTAHSIRDDDDKINSPFPSESLPPLPTPGSIHHPDPAVTRWLQRTVSTSTGNGSVADKPNMPSHSPSSSMVTTSTNSHSHSPSPSVSMTASMSRPSGHGARPRHISVSSIGSTAPSLSSSLASPSSASIGIATPLTPTTPIGIATPFPLTAGERDSSASPAAGTPSKPGAGLGTSHSRGHSHGLGHARPSEELFPTLYEGRPSTEVASDAVPSDA